MSLQLNNQEKEILKKAFQKETPTFPLIFLGNSRSGKTTLVEALNQAIQNEFGLEVEQHNLDSLTSNFHKNASTEEKQTMGELLDVENFEDRVKTNKDLMEIGDKIYQKFEARLILEYLNNTKFDEKKVHLADPGAKFPLNKEIVELVKEQQIPLVQLKVDEEEIKERLTSDYKQFLKWDTNERKGSDKGLRSNFIKVIDSLRKNANEAPSEEQELEATFNYYFNELEPQREPTYKEVADTTINVIKGQSIEDVLSNVLKAYVQFSIQKEFSSRPKHENPLEYLDLEADQPRKVNSKEQQIRMSPFI